jgi:hypothetical protein
MTIAEMIALWVLLIAIFMGIRHFAKTKYSRSWVYGSEPPASRFLFALAAVLCVALAILELVYGQSPVLPVTMLAVLGTIMAFTTGGRRRLR